MTGAKKCIAVFAAVLVVSLAASCGGPTPTPIAALLDQIGCADCPRLKLDREADVNNWVEGTDYAVTACVNREGSSTVWLWSAYERERFADAVIIDFQPGPTWREIEASKDKCFLMNATYEGLVEYQRMWLNTATGSEKHRTFVVNDFVEIGKSQHNKGKVLKN